MAFGVVDILEVIDVDHDQACRPRRSMRGDQFLGLEVEPAPVAEAGECIGGAQFVELPSACCWSASSAALRRSTLPTRAASSAGWQGLRR